MKAQTQLLVASIATVMLAACSGATTATPPLNSSGVPFPGVPGAKSGALLYVSDARSNDVLVYSYPHGEQVGIEWAFSPVAIRSMLFRKALR